MTRFWLFYEWLFGTRKCFKILTDNQIIKGDKEQCLRLNRLRILSKDAKINANYLFIA